MKIKNIAFIGLSATVLSVSIDSLAGEMPDTIKTKDLKEVVVEGKTQSLTSQSAVYIPTPKQKTASINAVDLINRLGMNEVSVNLIGNKVETHDRKPVAIFIDYVPASANDLQAMRMTDVKKVEYFNYPSDPRLQGNPYVINFIMQKYEYGGYVKASANETFVNNDGSLLVNAKLQYKRMTYDIMGFGFYSDNHHKGNQDLETFRLPQDDGTTKVFERYSSVNGSKYSSQRYMATFRAAYNSDKVFASSIFSAGLTPTPHSDQDGFVSYSPDVYPSSSYHSASDSRSKFLQYNGNYFFYLPKGNSIFFMPSYTYSHTSQNSRYLEQGFAPIDNGAYDNTNNLNLTLRYTHDFGNGGNLSFSLKEDYQHSRTQYAGSAVSLERNRAATTGVNARYSLSKGNFYGEFAFGWDWSALKTNDVKDNTNSPNAEISLSYLIAKKHRISGDYSFSTWAPSTSFKSENVIEASPLMKYTGNPNLVPFRSHSVSARYAFFPSNRLSLNVFGSAWIVGDRYVYDYEATPTGILRTIKQPLGNYSIANYGVSATFWAIKNTLAFQGSVRQNYMHNGSPYNIDKTYTNFSLNAWYYVKNFNFAANYSSPSAWSDGCMVGGWMKSKETYYVLAGWSNSKFNVRFIAQNFFRWNWRANKMITRSSHYDYVRQYIDTYSHASFSLSLTYTFGFGKKVKQNDELRARDASSSSILK